jgi:hypothetical protein
MISMPTTAQLNYAKYLISRLNVSQQMKNELNNEVESMNLDTAITFIDDLKKGNLLEWEMKAADTPSDGDLGRVPGYELNANKKERATDG